MSKFYSDFKTCTEKNSGHTAVLYCDNNKIINKLSYNDLLRLVHYLETKLKNRIEKCCVGLFIEPNPVLPAVILCVRKLQSSFFCIGNDIKVSQILDLFQRIGLQWLLIYNPTPILNNFLGNYALLVDILSLINDEFSLQLWKIKHVNLQLYKNISYVIRTSGTTGENKIIKVFDECITSNIYCLRTIFQITNTDIIFLSTPSTFDPFMVELMLGLTTGATLLIVPNYVKFNKLKLFQTLFPATKKLHSGVTFWQICPSVFLCYSENDIKTLFSEECTLRILALGGEKFPEKILRYPNFNKRLRIFNLYGITEVSCWASVEEVTHLKGDVSLGCALDDTILQIRDKNGQEIHDGEGELFVGSKRRLCLINNEKNLPEEVIYRETGDIVRIDKKLNKIFHVCRKNNIIKRFGCRINLSEVEKYISDTTDLIPFCFYDENSSKIVLFIVLEEPDKLVRGKIIDRLRIKLLHNVAAYAKPDIIEIIPSIPLTQNGKVDKKCLLNIVSINTEQEVLSAVEMFQNLWSKHFGMSPFEIGQQENSFISCGGNSILAIQFISEFDSLVANSYSADLMSLLLDQRKSFSDYCALISDKSISEPSTRTRKRSSDDALQRPIKQAKPEDKKLVNKNMCQLNVAWKCCLYACVDATPVYFEHPRLGGLVAVGSHAYIFLVIDSKSGSVVSRTDFTEPIEGSACISSCKEMAMVGCLDGTLFCIKVEDGNILWRYKTESSIKSTPVLSSDCSNVMFGSYDKSLYCLTVKDGSLVWKIKIDECIKSNTVVFDKNNYCYTATIQGTYFCVSEKTGQLIWKHKTDSPVFGSPGLIRELNAVIWADVKGHVNCFDCDNGDKLWEYECQGFVYSSICVRKRQILFGCIDHNVYCLECSRESCNEIFKIDIGEPISTTPCVLNLNNKEYMVVAHNKGKLHLLGFENLMLYQTIQLHGEVFSSPIVCSDKIYVGCRDDCVYSIEIKFPLT